MNEGKRLEQFWQAIDDAKSDFVPYLHLHHLGREAGAHTLSILQLELDLSTALLNQVKQEERRQSLKLIVRRVLTHIEDLRHATSLSSAYPCSFIAEAAVPLQCLERRGSSRSQAPL
jgi:hypothetical protein